MNVGFGRDLSQRRRNLRGSSCLPAGPRNPCKTWDLQSYLHYHPHILSFLRWAFTSPEHERVHVLAHLREEEPISCTGPLWQLLWAGLVWYLYLFALTTPMISSSVDCQSQPAETELPYFVLLLCAVRGYQYISYIFIEWDNFPLFHFAFPPFSPIFQHQKVGWIIENPCDFESSHPDLMLGDGPRQRLHPSHLDDLSISFYLYIN